MRGTQTDALLRIGVRSLIKFVVGLLRIFTPFWFRWLYHLPWWVYAGLVAWSAIGNFGIIQDRLTRGFHQASIETVPAPALVAVENFSPSAPRNEINEVYLRGRLRNDLGEVRLDTKILGRSILVFEGEGDPPKSVILYVQNIETTTLTEYLDSISDEDGFSELHGVVRSSTSDDAALVRAVASLDLDGDVLGIIDPFVGTREQMFAKRDSFGDLVLYSTSAFYIFLIILAIYNFRRAREKKAVAAKPAEKPRAKKKAEPRREKEAPTKASPKDAGKFNDSPIISKKGFFG